MRIGLFGGSFNPIHNGHIAIGRTVQERLRLDEVWFMVSPQNPLKRHSAELMDEGERLRLAGIALLPYPALKASDYEFRLPRPSYTWATLRRLRSDCPDCRFTLIIGADNWTHFNQWANGEEILAACDIAVFPRKGYLIDASALPGNVRLVDMPLINVSSTMIREMLRKGEDISRYVPSNILAELGKKPPFQERQMPQ